MRSRDLTLNRFVAFLIVGNKVFVILVVGMGLWSRRYGLVDGPVGTCSGLGMGLWIEEGFLLPRTYSLKASSASIIADSQMFRLRVRSLVSLPGSRSLIERQLTRALSIKASVVAQSTMVQAQRTFGNKHAGFE